MWEPRIFDVSDPATFDKCVGRSDKYLTFLNLFKSEIRAKGWTIVIEEYLFGGNARADDLLVKLFESESVLQVACADDPERIQLMSVLNLQVVITRSFILVLGSSSTSHCSLRKLLPKQPSTKILFYLYLRVLNIPNIRATPHQSDQRTLSLAYW